MKRMPQPIPYQGSKRRLAATILGYIPNNTDKLIEPFAGTAAVSICAAYYQKAKQFHLNDTNKPLMELVRSLIEHPEDISSKYSHLWNQQIGNENDFYYRIRNQFNQASQPELLLYLLARCVKAAVRYNLNGEFNQSPDKRRKGKTPARMNKEILEFSDLLKGRTQVTWHDFTDMLDDVNVETDVVYLDPPYAGTSTHRNRRYLDQVSTASLIEFVDELTKRNIMFMLSYDGHRGHRHYGSQAFAESNLLKLRIRAGRSAQSTLLGKQEVTYESLYLSLALANRLKIQEDGPPNSSVPDGSDTMPLHLDNLVHSSA